MTERSLFARCSPWVLAAFAFLTPSLFYAAHRAVRSNVNKIEDWLPKRFTETGQLAWFRRHFVGDQFVVISWDGCRLGEDLGQPGADEDDPRIEQLAEILVPSDDRTASVAAAPPSELAKKCAYYFKSVTTGRRLLDQLISPPTNVPYEEAVRRLTGSLIGVDGHQTCVLVTLTDQAISDVRGAVGRGTAGYFRVHHKPGVLFDALKAVGIDEETVRLGGPPVDNVAIDEEGERTMIRLAGLAGLLGLGLAWFSLRSLKLTLIVFSCGVLSAAGGLAAVWLSGQTTDAVVLSMPSLVYVLAISGAVHLINYYRDAVQQDGLHGAPERAIAHGWKPAMLCSVTTALGLLSLYASDLVPIRKFGTYAALGVMLMLVVLFLYLPACLSLWPIRVGDAVERLETRRRGAIRRRARLARFLSSFWERFGSWIIRRQMWVTTASVVLIAIVGFGVTRVRTSIDLMKLFDGEARILQDYRWLESKVGRLVPMEIVLRFAPESLGHNQAAGQPGLSLLDRMQVVVQAQRTIEEYFGAAGQNIVGPSISAVTFVPPLPTNRQGTSATVRRAVTNTKLEKGYDTLLNSGYLRLDPLDGAELWRISVRIAAFQNVDYGRFADEMRRVVDPVAARISGAMPSLGDQPITTVYTGVVPIVYKAQRALLDSLIRSTFWSFITITPLLMFVSRGVRAGLVAMLPNVLPVLVIFGGMGWLGLPVDIGSMMSASIALGVAVDDTIHYLTWFREDLVRHENRRRAILAAYRRCATPTLQAALINGLGLSVFAVSTFTPTKQFGYLMLAILLAGVVAELVMLPALLAGPLGRAFAPSRKKCLGFRFMKPPKMRVSGQGTRPQGAEGNPEQLVGPSSSSLI